MKKVRTEYPDCICSKDGQEVGIEFEPVLSSFKNHFQINYALRGFGNSDCERNCYSHLLYSAKKVSHNQLTSLYHSAVRLIPSSIETSGRSPNSFIAFDVSTVHAS